MRRKTRLPAFKLGLKLGANGIESDVWLTQDRVPVLEHDGYVKHYLRKRVIGDLKRSQLPSFVPSLAEMLDECGTEFTCRSISRAMTAVKQYWKSCVRSRGAVTSALVVSPRLAEPAGAAQSTRWCETR